MAGGSTRIITVLYATTSELKVVRSCQRDGSGKLLSHEENSCSLFSGGLNACSLSVPEGSLFVDPGDKSKAYMPAHFLMDQFPLQDGAGGELRFFVKQRTPGRGSTPIMWLLVNNPDEQIIVDKDEIYVQVARMHETPLLPLADDTDETWWDSGSGTGAFASSATNQTDGPSSSRTSRSSSSSSKPRSEQKAGLGQRFDSANATKIASKAAIETLNKTSENVAAGLGKFASWAKRGIAAATEAINLAETVSLSSHTVEIKRKLADGGFSEVFLVKDAESGEDFALKRCLAHSSNDVKDIRAEIDLHRKIRSEFVMSILDSTETGAERGMTRVMMLFPLYTDGSLFDAMESSLKNGRAWPFPERAAIHFSLGLIRGLQAVHDAGFAHRDIKPHNVLIGRTGSKNEALNCANNFASLRPILMDLGSAAPLRRKVSSRNEAMMAVDEASRKCSEPYRAVELFEIPELPYTFDAKQDVWSIGTTIFAMTFGRMYSPFEHPTQGVLKLAILQANVNFPSGEYSKGFQKILQQTMAKNAEDRPSLKSLYTKLSELN